MLGKIFTSRKDRQQDRARPVDDSNRATWDVASLITRVIDTNLENWIMVMEICDRVNHIDLNAKEASKTLRNTIQSGQPIEQLAAARLWTIMIIKCQTYFLEHTANRKFLGRVEEVTLAPTTSPVVRDRLVEAVGTAVYQLKESIYLPSYQTTWIKFRTQLVPSLPADGIMLNSKDPILSPNARRMSSLTQEYAPGPFSSADSDNTVNNLAQGETHQNIGSSREVRQYNKSATFFYEEAMRLSKECETSMVNCRALEGLLGSMESETAIQNPQVQELRGKCLNSQEMIVDQINRVTALDEQSLPTGPGGPVSTGVKEHLLEVLCAADIALERAMNTYDDVALIVVSERSRKESDMHVCVDEMVQDENRTLTVSPETNGFDSSSLNTLVPLPRRPLPPPPSSSFYVHSANTAPTPAENLDHTLDTEIRDTVQNNNTITSTMSITEVMEQLAEHNCPNLTKDLDVEHCMTMPMSKGGLGDVYKGTLKDGKKVALKCLRLYVGVDEENRKALKHVAREMYAWSKCKHSNVVELLGFAEFQGHIAMVSPWMEKGGIDRLDKNSNVDRRQLCSQIADGLAYLHRINVVHGDLKGANVLLSNDGVAQLTDFGNAILISSTLTFTASTNHNRFSTRWAAPEQLENRVLCSCQADIYSLGMTILEVVSRQLPYAMIRNDVAVITTVIVKKERPKRPEDTIPTEGIWGNTLWSLLESCWSWNPEHRPTAAQVAGIIAAIR